MPNTQNKIHLNTEQTGIQYTGDFYRILVTWPFEIQTELFSIQMIFKTQIIPQPNQFLPFEYQTC